MKVPVGVLEEQAPPPQTDRSRALIVSLPLSDIHSRLKNPRQSGKLHTAPCPAHDDHDPSLTVEEKSDGAVRVKCWAGCPPAEIASALGLADSDWEMERCVVAEYDYLDAHGTLLYQAVRYDPKAFKQRRPDGKGGWTWNLQGVKRVPYQLPKLLAADHSQTVLVVEGEKDADRLAQLGFVATTNAGGAETWRGEYNRYFRGRQVVIIPDNDEPGYEHAENVARNLYGIAASVRILNLPNLPEKGDVTDWLHAGGTANELKQLLAEAPEWQGGGLDKVHHHHHHQPPREGDDDDDGPIDLSTLPEPPPLEYVVEGFIPEGFATNLYGDSGQGKSYIALALVACVSTGEPFLGREVKPGPVLFLDWELDQNIQRLRLGEIARGMGIPIPSVIYRRMTLPLFDSLKDICCWLAEYKPVLTIIDSVGKALGDDPLDHKKIIQFYSKLDELGTFLCIDHQPKRSGETPYANRSEFGSSYKRHLARSSWQLEKTGDTAGRADLVFRHQKCNFSPQLPNTHAVLCFGEDEWGQKSVSLELTGTTGQVTAQSPRRAEKILQALESGRATAEQLAEATGCSVGGVRNKLTELTKTGQVVVAGGVGKAQVYDLNNRRESKESEGNGSCGGAVAPCISADHHHHHQPLRESDDDDESEGAQPAPPKTTEPRLPTLCGSALLDSVEAVEGVVKKLSAEQVVSLSIVTTGDDPHRDGICQVRLATRSGFYIIDTTKVSLQHLRPILESEGCKVVYDGKHLLEFFLALGLVVNNVYDLMLADQAIRSNNQPQPLDKLTTFYLGKKRGNSVIPARATLLTLHEKIDAEIVLAGLAETMSIENRVLPAVASMQYSGIPFAAAQAAALLEKLEAEKKELEGELTAIAGAKLGAELGDNITVNWRFSQEALELLRLLGINAPSAKKRDLQPLAGQYPIVKKYLRYTDVSSDITVGKGLLNNYNPVTGRIHGDWKQLGAATGRMSCRRPALQNIPSSSIFRSYIRAPEGRAFVGADLSQIEPRIIAEVTGDEGLNTIFRNGGDIYKAIAAQIKHKDIESIEDDERNTAKVVFLGVFYGMGARTVAERVKEEYKIELSEKEARDFIEELFATFPRVKAWHESKWGDASTETRTLAGRRRQNVSSLPTKINTPIQGTAADGFKAVMALLWERRDLCPSAKIILARHDEVITECDKDDIPTAKEWLTTCIKEGMGVYVKEVVIEAKVYVGEDWKMK